MIHVRDIAAAIEKFAPLALQESYDNTGLAVGAPTDEVGRVLLAVDVTEEVLSEAIAKGCDMVVTHHPLLFHPLRRLSNENYVERCVLTAVRQGIALYSAHTNLDSARGGMSWRVGKKLGLTQMSVLEPSISEDTGFGVVGDLTSPMPMTEFLQVVADALHVKALRYGKVCSPTIRRVAVCTGAGASLAVSARKSGCDVYVTADLKYNDFLDAVDTMTVIDAGHYETELCAVELLEELLTPTGVELCRSEASHSPINHMMF